MPTYAGLRLTRFETAPPAMAEIFGGGYLLAFEASSTRTFEYAVAAVKALPAEQRRWLRPFGAWWISADGAEALAAQISAIADALGAPRRRKRKTSSARSRTDTAAASSLPAPVAAAFDTLHLLPSAPPYVVQGVYRLLAQRAHPDHAGGDTAAMQRINGAYELARPWAEQQQQARSA
jgi:hypothetical protein